MKRFGYGAGLSLVILGLVLLAHFVLASCAGPGSSGGVVSSGSGTVTTNISDPPTCGTSTGGQFLNVWVTITRVRAHITADADPNASGWAELVDLRSNPMQIDLLNLASSNPASTDCLLTQLGSATGLPPGNYQQIRVVLLSNSPSAGAATPSPNHCGANGFNCVVLADGSVQELRLSSEADTGIKIPQGQIAGGGINLTASQSADLNIDFNACASIVGEGNGQFHLKPTLHAGEVSLNTNSISGRVVDSSTPPNPIPNALVLIEQPDSGGVDRVVSSKMANSDGTFFFCGLAMANYDIVTAGQTTSGMITTTYNATILFNVPTGTAVGNIPLLPESPSSSVSTSPATITGQVTTTGSSGAVSGDITLTPLQPATPAGGPALMVTIPVFGATSQPPTLATSGSGCSSTTLDCATYTLSVPASNPEVGTFNPSGTTTFTAPASGNALYTVEAEAANCTPSTFTSTQLMLSVGGMPQTANFAFMGCM